MHDVGPIERVLGLVIGLGVAVGAVAAAATPVVTLVLLLTKRKSDGGPPPTRGFPVGPVATDGPADDGRIGRTNGPT